MLSAWSMSWSAWLANEQQEPLPSQSAQNAAQRMVDSMSYLSETVSTISAKPTKMMSDWIADRIAPPYWVPNARLQHCGKCEKEFADVDSKHHW